MSEALWFRLVFVIIIAAYALLGGLVHLVSRYIESRKEQP